MNKILVKQIIILSLILGMILGVLAPIPYVGMVMLILILLFVAPAVMVYMIMDGKFNLTSIVDSIAVGALAGFCANLTFSSVFTLITWILAVGFNFTPNMFLSAMITNSPIWLLITFIIFVGVLCATTNAFTGVLTHYIIDFIRDMYEKRNK